jgi:hypothetical protein
MVKKWDMNYNKNSGFCFGKKGCLLFFLFIVNFSVFGQDINYHQAPNTAKTETKKTINKDFLEKISVGGTGGFSFGQIISVEVAPHVAYHFNQNFCVGVGGSYLFFKDRIDNYSTHVFGATVFAEAHFLKYLGVHAAYQALNYDNPVHSLENERIWSNNLSMGGGYYQRVGRTIVYFYVLYNLSDRPSRENIYGNPLFKMGISYLLK